MLRSFGTIKNGIERTMDSNDVIANNMANINTIGFKQSKILFKDIREVEIQKLKGKQEYDPQAEGSSSVGKLSLGPEVSQIVIDFSQGDFINTGNKFDFAINGEGFFSVLGADNEELFTRKGNFVVDSQGFLTTTTGEKIANRDGGFIQLDMETRKPENIVVTKDGVMTFGKERIGALKISEFKDKSSLVPIDGGLFKNINPENKSSSSNNPCVLQGSLEGSNANAITTMLKSIEALRSYESMAGAMQTTSDTLSKVVNQVGRF